MNKKNQYRLIKLIVIVILWTILIKFLEHSIPTKNLIGLIILFISTLISMFDLREKYNIDDKILGKQLVILFIIYNTYFLWGVFKLLIPFLTVSILGLFKDFKKEKL